MKFVSPFLKRVVYPSMARAGMFRRAQATGLAVVTYHGVLPDGYEIQDPALDGNLISAQMLRRQIRLLKTNYNVVSPDELRDWRRGTHELPPRAVVLTCDDGLLNCLTDMLPVLQAENVSCLFFVTDISSEGSRKMLWYEELCLLFLCAADGMFEVPYADTVFEADLGPRKQRLALWWDAVQRLSQIDAPARDAFLAAASAVLRVDRPRDTVLRATVSSRRFGLLTAAEVRKLESAGMAIGAHTLNHPVLAQVSSEIANAEICGSRQMLESVVQRPIWAFAYPFGNSLSVTPEVLGLPRTAGFEMAFVNYGGGLGAELPPFAMPRIHVTADMSISEFEAHVSGFYRRLQSRAGRNHHSPAA